MQTGSGGNRVEQRHCRVLSIELKFDIFDIFVNLKLSLLTSYVQK